MPLESKAQGRFLNWKFGHDWVKRHHFGGSQKGLPQHVKKQGGGVIADIGKQKDHMTFKQMGIRHG